MFERITYRIKPFQLKSFCVIYLGKFGSTIHFPLPRMPPCSPRATLSSSQGSMPFFKSASACLNVASKAYFSISHPGLRFLRTSSLMVAKASMCESVSSSVVGEPGRDRDGEGVGE